MYSIFRNLALILISAKFFALLAANAGRRRWWVRSSQVLSSVPVC